MSYTQGWMFMLEDTAEWRKFWFVLNSSGLRYYTHLEDEERDEPDGEIDIRRGLKVVEFEADMNYGLQIQMPDAEITLSAVTSRVRKNWIESLRSCIRAAESPDIIQQPSSSLHPVRVNSGSEVITPRRDVPAAMPSSDRREAGVGIDQEQERRFGDRTKWFREGLEDRESDSPWSRLELKKGVAVQIHEAEADIEVKWKDLEKIPIGEMRPLSPIGSQAPAESGEVLQTEVSSSRQQVEELREGRIEPGAPGQCGPGSRCASRLEQMEREHREKLQEMEREQERERREMERRRDQMLKEEAQHAAGAMEALRKIHGAEMERLRGGEQSDVSAVMSESLSLMQQQLDALSDRYSRRCLELNELQDSTGLRHSQLQEREKQIRVLQKENQELQAYLTEEMAAMRSFLTGQSSGDVPPGSDQHSTSEIQLMLRAKENEVEYLRREIGCLRSEVQSLTQEKEELSERYKEVYVELCEVKGLGKREVGTLKEHLRLANAALDEERRHGK
ncbi:TRIO and F-actin-binding protein isoform X2 [Trichomycterus rosablanca]|uniref:TRIO and F-actin-binding protein isoform X2 n=1 Tax=Trichomycterus rosablanca TaxID=2290929 RepID=UPI002F35F897